MPQSRSLTERLERLPPGRHLMPREYVVRSQRERILAALAELVGEHGYQKTTIESIARTARVALATFYEQFSSKEECFLAAFEESVAAAGEAFDEAIDEESPWADQVVAALATFSALVAAEPARARLCLIESQAAGSRALAGYQAMVERIAARLREGRRLNPGAERLPDGVEVGIVGGVFWLTGQRLLAGRAEELAEQLPAMTQLVLAPYMGAEAAATAR